MKYEREIKQTKNYANIVTFDFIYYQKVDSDITLTLFNLGIIWPLQEDIYNCGAFMVKTVSLYFFTIQKYSEGYHV